MFFFFTAYSIVFAMPTNYKLNITIMVFSFTKLASKLWIKRKIKLNLKLILDWHLPFLRLSWFSPPAWKSYRATKSCGSSSSWASRFSLDVQRAEASRGRGRGAGSPSGRSGMWGSGLLCSRASVTQHKTVITHVDLGDKTISMSQEGSHWRLSLP